MTRLTSADPDDVADKIQQLMGLGFDRAQCTQALSLCDGSAERAASYLFESSMGF